MRKVDFACLLIRKEIHEKLYPDNSFEKSELGLKKNMDVRNYAFNIKIRNNSWSNTEMPVTSDFVPIAIGIPSSLKYIKGLLSKKRITT